MQNCPHCGEEVQYNYEDFQISNPDGKKHVCSPREWLDLTEELVSRLNSISLLGMTQFHRDFYRTILDQRKISKKQLLLLERLEWAIKDSMTPSKSRRHEDWDDTLDHLGTFDGDC
jgi:hypothetical protein